MWKKFKGAAMFVTINERKFYIIIKNEELFVSILIDGSEILLIRGGHFSLTECYTRLEQYSTMENDELFSRAHSIIRG